MTPKQVLSAFAIVAGLAFVQPAAALPLEYDCDTQSEHYSVLKAVQSGPDYSARGKISLQEIFAVKDYVTLGVLQFQSIDRAWRARVGFSALKAGKDTVVMGTLEITRNGKAEEPRALGQIFEYEPRKTYPIYLSLSRGQGKAMLGANTVSFNLPVEGKIETSVVCSGGEFLFTDLKLDG